MAPHSADYSVAIRNQNTNLGVPAQIKCTVCRSTKPSTCFSKKQHQRLLEHMRRSPGFNTSRDAYAVCTSCTSQQVVELTCFRCDKSMGLDNFTKAQRKTPDHAECMRCQEDRKNIEPDEVSDSNPSSAHSDDDDSDDSYHMTSTAGGAPLHSDTDRLDLNDTYLAQSSTDGSSIGGDARAQSSRRQGTLATHTSNANTTSLASEPDTSTAYGSQPGSVYGAPTSSVKSTAASSICTTSGRPAFDRNKYRNSSSRASTGQAPATRSDGRKFAKIKAVPRKAVSDVAGKERLGALNNTADEDVEFEMSAEEDD